MYRSRRGSQKRVVITSYDDIISNFFYFHFFSQIPLNQTLRNTYGGYFYMHFIIMGTDGIKKRNYLWVWGSYILTK